MCLIIKKPAGRSLCPAFIENAWRHNHDGWGSFFLQGGRPVWAKGMGFDDLQAHARALPDSTEAYLHLRRATHGAINHAMAHPHVVHTHPDDGHDLLLMHNGCIDHLAAPGTDTPHSDTAVLADLLRDMLQGLSPVQAARLIRSQGFARLTAPLIEGSMVVLLDAQGAVRLGREWHVVQPCEWQPAMAGFEVSNTRTWLATDALAA